MFASLPASHRFFSNGEDGPAADGRRRSMLDELGSRTHLPGKVGRAGGTLIAAVAPPIP
ncbi:hypothetical protein BDI4_1060041 [Burkholderia diffusa]|nr:hypothetical protein BDI4_1060041 [Burkholderia diffusa]